MPEAGPLGTLIAMVVSVVLLLVGAAAVFAIYMQVRRHQQRLELDKVQAEESSRAKTTFLFNMSHDIRTPMNASICCRSSTTCWK